MKKITPILITLCVIFIFYIKRFIVLKFYPPICNLFIFSIFFFSLFAKETVVQKIAKIQEGVLSESALIYTRRVTYVWAIFTFLNFLISIWTIFQTDKIWMLYNGLVSYLLVGIVFGIEYLIRIRLKRRNLI